jgi:wyosine [tRNA(Phe)-imidazoG37] synthetase (radical SAM superfamily)
MILSGACLVLVHLLYSWVTLDRILERIATFSKEQAGRSMRHRVLKKQSDADEIRKWDKEIMRAYETFHVSIRVFMQPPAN